MAFSIPIWIIVTLVLLIILIILMRTTNQVYLLSLIKSNFFYFFAIAIFIFMTISLTYIHTTHDISLKSLDGIKTALKIYYSWAANVFSNIGKVTGYALQQDWVNSTK